MNTNTKEIGYEDAGNHKVTIMSSDGNSKTTKEFIIPPLTRELPNAHWVVIDISQIK